MSRSITRRLFTASDYHRMVDAGILSERDRVELIHGEVLALSPLGPRHCASIDRTNKLMINLAGDKAIVRIQSTVGLDDYNEPQPDVVLMRPREDFYASKHPGPSDILLIIEVAESSLQYDRGIMARLYAEMRIAEYWVLDLQSNTLLAYSEPAGKSYRVVRQFQRGDVLAPALLPECQIAVDALLP